MLWGCCIGTRVPQEQPPTQVPSPTLDPQHQIPRPPRPTPPHPPPKESCRHQLERAFSASRPAARKLELLGHGNGCVLARPRLFACRTLGTGVIGWLLPLRLARPKSNLQNLTPHTHTLQKKVHARGVPLLLLRPRRRHPRPVCRGGGGVAGRRRDRGRPRRCVRVCLARECSRACDMRGSKGDAFHPRANADGKQALQSNPPPPPENQSLHPRQPAARGLRRRVAAGLLPLLLLGRRGGGGRGQPRAGEPGAGA